MAAVSATATVAGGTFHELILPPGVTHIVHVADLHVRSGVSGDSRAQEYADVLARFLSEVAVLPAVRQGRAVMVIAGDIHHDKCLIGASGLKIMYDWLKRALELLPVLVIAGNHDIDQARPDRTDSVEALCVPFEGEGHAHRYRLQYLKASGLYLSPDGALGIGVTALRDTLSPLRGSGNRTDMPAFPSPAALPSSVTCKVALFHGTIKQSALPSGGALEHGISLKWFKGYDIVVLGDNHLQQIHAARDGLPAWGYPGSLLQQGFGEPVFGHGYIVWDLTGPAPTATRHHLRNERGFVTMMEGGDVRLDGRRMSAAAAAALPGFPSRPRVRVEAPTADAARRWALAAEAEAALREAGVCPQGSVDVYCGAVAEGTELGREALRESVGRMADLGSREVWQRFSREFDGDEFAARTAAFFSDDIEAAARVEVLGFGSDSDVPGLECLAADVVARNAAVAACYREYDRVADVARGDAAVREVELLSLRWNWLLSYGEGNEFDFESLRGRVAHLKGRNASGKSGFLDVLLLAMFGTTSSVRREAGGGGGGGRPAAHSADIINRRRPAKTAAPGASLRFRVEGRIYQITRTFATQNNTGDRTQRAVVRRVDEIDERGRAVPVAEDARVNAFAAEVFGTPLQVQMSAMLTQNDSETFISQKGEVQNRVLRKALNLEAIEAFGALLKESRNAHAAAVKGVHALRQLNRRRDGPGGDDAVPDLDLDAAADAVLAAERRRRELEDVARGLAVSLGPDVDAEEAATWPQMAERPAGVDEREAAEAPRVLGELRRRLEALGPVEAEDAGPKEPVEALLLRRDEHLRSAPLVEPSVSIAFIEEREALHAAWCAAQPWTGPYAAQRAVADAHLLRVWAERLRDGAQILEGELRHWDRHVDGTGTSNDDETPFSPPCSVPYQYSQEEAALDLLPHRDALLEVDAERPSIPLPSASALDDARRSLAAHADWRSSLPAPEWVDDPALANAEIARLAVEIKRCDDAVRRYEAARVHANGPDDCAADCADSDADCADSDDDCAADCADASAEAILARLEEIRATRVTLTRPYDHPEALRDWLAKREEWDALLLTAGDTPAALVLLDARQALDSADRADAQREEAIATLVELQGARDVLTRCHVLCDCSVLPLRIEALTLDAELALEQRERLRLSADALAARASARLAFERQAEDMRRQIAAWDRAAEEHAFNSVAYHYSLRLWKRLEAVLHAERARLQDARDRFDACLRFVQEWPARRADREAAAARSEAAGAGEAWERKLGRVIHDAAPAVSAARSCLRRAVAEASEADARDRAATEFAAEVGRRTCDIEALEQLKPAALWRQGLQALESRLAAARRRDLLAEISRASLAADVRRSDLGAVARRLLQTQSVELPIAAELEARAIGAAVMARDAADRVLRFRRSDAALAAYQARLEDKQQDVAALYSRMAVVREAGPKDGPKKREKTAADGDDNDGSSGGEGAASEKTAESAFVRWVHKEHAFPLLEREINSFLTAMGDFSVHIGIKKDNSPDFFVEHEGAVVSINFASGYQKQTIGLAARIALSRIGAVGSTMRTLFIDEGFGATDAENLLPIGDVLRTIRRVGGYHNIIVISHLEAIANAADVVIRVARDTRKNSSLRVMSSS
jgi:hypothetical protein